MDDSKINVYTHLNSFLFTWSLPPDLLPRQVAAVKDGRILVPAPQLNSVLVCNPHANQESGIILDGIANPHYLAIYDEASIVITSCDQHKVGKFPMNDRSPAEWLVDVCYPTGVCVDSRSQLIYVACENSRERETSLNIAIISPTGKPNTKWLTLERLLAQRARRSPGENIISLWIGISSDSEPSAN